MPNGFVNISDKSKERLEEYGYKRNSNNDFSNATSVLSGTLSSAATLATTLSFLGPLGMVIGGIAGGALGFFTGASKIEAEDKKQREKYNSALESLIQGESDLINRYNQELEDYNLLREEQNIKFDTQSRENTNTLLNTQIETGQSVAQKLVSIAQSGFRNTASATNARLEAQREGNLRYTAERENADYQNYSNLASIRNTVQNMNQSTDNLNTMLTRYNKAYEDLKKGNDIDSEIANLNNLSSTFKNLNTTMNDISKTVKKDKK